MSRLRELLHHNHNQREFSNLLNVSPTFRQDFADRNPKGFTIFDSSQYNESIVLVRKYYTLSKEAKENNSDPIQPVILAAQEDFKTEDPEKVQYALMIFVSHHPEARSRGLRIPPLTHRSPDISVPKQGTSTPTPSTGQPANEHSVSYWLEDPNLNEHHEHWHVVYPPGELPNPENPRGNVAKDRQGELFLYMHRQMNARYDAERASVGLAPAKPLSNYKEVIPEDYNPNKHLIVEPGSQKAFSARPAGIALKDITDEGGTTRVSELVDARQNILQAIQQGKFENGKKITPDLLGSVIQSSLDGNEQYRKYGSLHNTGHMLLSYIHNPNSSDPRNSPGVISDPRSAVRDPIFFRWHKHVDEFFIQWQKTLPPNDFKDSPPVKIQQNGFILAFKDKITGINKSLNDAQQDQLATKWGEDHFGGANFSKDPDASVSTTTLETKLKKRNWVWIEDDKRSDVINYLFPREWYYFFRVENTSNQNLNLTFRVFLAPEKTQDLFETWIELDKFKSSIKAGSKVVIARDCDKSSVVRQPPQKTDDQLDDTVTPPTKEDSVQEQYCDCGWPFHLLLPRGTPQGTPYKLLAFISDWNLDKVPETNTRCGSMTFCGAERPNDKYPDTRPMGYPFDRPFKNNSFKQTFTGLNNANVKDIKITFVNDFPEMF